MAVQLKRKNEEYEADEKPHPDRKQEEKDLDKALEDSFPGSDPVSITQPIPEPNRSQKERNPRRH